MRKDHLKDKSEDAMSVAELTFRRNGYAHAVRQAPRHGNREDALRAASEMDRISALLRLKSVEVAHG